AGADESPRLLPAEADARAPPARQRSFERDGIEVVAPLDEDPTGEPRLLADDQEELLERGEVAAVESDHDSAKVLRRTASHTSMARAPLQTASRGAHDHALCNASRGEHGRPGGTSRAHVLLMKGGPMRPMNALSGLLMFVSTATGVAIGATLAWSSASSGHPS